MSGFSPRFDLYSGLGPVILAVFYHGEGEIVNSRAKKIPRRRITSREFFRLNSVSSLDFAGAQATRADINVLYGAVDNSLNTSDIGLPGSVAASVRVRNLYSESYTLTAVIAFSHDLNTSVIA